MFSKRSIIAYGLLIAAWVAICVWQRFEHDRAQESAQIALLNRAGDISNSLGIVIRSQRRFGMVFQDQLVAALEELTNSSELLAVALLNLSGEIVASSGETIDPEVGDLTEKWEDWGPTTVTVANLIDLGPEDEPSRPAVIVQPGDGRPRGFGGGRGFREGRRRGFRGERPGGRRPPEGRPREGDRPPPPEGPDGPAEEFGGPRGEGSGGPRGRRPFGPPPWMSPDEFAELTATRGVHYFVLSMSTAALDAEIADDFSLRITSVWIALVAAMGLGAAWFYLDRSSALQHRLSRASEMNLHLKESNTAAAGLAHETRNPLNIIRGLAQIISKDSGTPDHVRKQSLDITEEVDRVTARLNQFLEYSKPFEVRPASTNLLGVARDVARTLESDAEDKSIRFDFSGPDVVIEADESLLRQVLFNLLLNAVQAVGEEGTIEVMTEMTSRDRAQFDVRDSGPGVPEEEREEIFRPYFTASEHGTGLGLTIVRQIVLAHQWTIACLPGEHRGSVFRVSGLEVI